ncbi:MAG: DUF5686 and carboxypeptidase regulatory-like domain-containing protein [Flavobacterium sp.]
MKNLLLFLSLTFTFSIFAQIKGTITDIDGTPLPSVSVMIDNTYKNVTSNEQGNYVLDYNILGKHTLVFRSVGYKTQIVTIKIDKFPFVQNVKLSDENLTLNEIIVNPKENLADGIIRKAIANRKENSRNTSHFKADFYSKGIFKVKDVPKKILNVKIDDINGSLDSTRSGIIYLSETVSKIVYQKPDKLKETIIASKVSGNNNGFSFNTAEDTSFDFYDNTVDIGYKMISPIANNAFNYYKFKIEGTFNDENNQMINKIKVIAKRDTEPVFEGYIYIVEDSWAIYAIDLNTKGYRMHQEILETLNLKQNFSYNQNNHIWAKNSQSLEFEAGIFGIKFNGKFDYVFSNYEFFDSFSKKTFTNEIVNFEKDSNKKDSNYWNNSRPIPLSEEENKDYVKKDSIQTVRNSKKYLDSIDKKNNKFHFYKILTGYNYKNSYNKESFNYEGIFNFSSLNFNTVQGWNMDSGFSYSKRDKENKGQNTSIGTNFNYGFSENRFRITGNFHHQFNNQNYASLNISGGSKAAQFNPEEPISKTLNTISSLFFEDNYMKLYNKEFAAINYSQFVANGLFLKGQLEYQQRKPLFNNTSLVWIKHDDNYWSNNPLSPYDDSTPAFSPHHLTKATLSAKINFGNKYISRPDGKINIANEKYPTLYLDYYNAFAANDKIYNHQFFSAKINYEITIGNKGNFATNIKSGKFINGGQISFVDYRHFNGNQTHIGTTDRYLNVFNLMPYYSNSTNDAYFENHTEYNDNGFIINKIPLLNLLKSTMILGFHDLAIPKMKPYTEYTIGLDKLGFGKFKMLRIDYVRSYQNGFKGDGVVFGLKFFDLID